MTSVTAQVRYLRTRKLDDLCPRCWNPSLMSGLYMLVLPDQDRGPVIEATACMDCDTDIEE